MPQKTTILNLHRLGAHEYLVALACGHSYSVSDTDLARLSLFVGKRISCHECAQQKQGLAEFLSNPLGELICIAH